MHRFNKAALRAACLLAAGFAAGQDQPEAIFRSETRLVVLHATVIDRSGQFVTNLPQKAFKVLENGVEQQIKLFKREDSTNAASAVNTPHST